MQSRIKENFFQFIIDKKYISVTDINWSVVTEKWPSISKTSLSEAARGFQNNHGKKGTENHKHTYKNIEYLFLKQYFFKKII